MSAEQKVAGEEISITDLVKEVRYLRDRQEITDCIHRYARAIDRHDSDLMQTVYHEDGIDSHGRWKFDDPKIFIEWMNATHEANFGLHHHQVSVQNCEIEGDTANCETYVTVFLVVPGAPNKVWVCGGRYLDRLERRKGEWKLAYRSPVMDWAFEGESIFERPEYLASGMTVGTSNKSDPSYDRPYRPEPGWKATSREELEASIAWAQGGES